jgi:histidine ammonia-lyase
MNQQMLLNRILSWDQLRRFVEQPPQSIELSPEMWDSVRRNRAFLERKIQDPGQRYYGINTGFGALCDVVIPPGDLEQLQENLVMSHACGIGREMDEQIIRLMYLFKIHGLAQGHSGISEDTLRQLCLLYKAGIMPVVYDTGSLGASGDLAPLAHFCLPLLGMGEVYYCKEKMSASEALAKAGLKPIRLKAKEGLALLNGTQFMTATGCFALLIAERLMKQADLNAAISIDAFDASTAPFQPAIHRVRRHAGQQKSADRILKWLSDSPIASGVKSSVQDPYSFRCVPQVHGAALTVLEHVRSVFENEINAVTDNPLLFEEEDLIVSGGNFHGEPLALALDYLCLGMAELGNISERRTFQLLSGKRGLPKFLVAESGLNSGFMIPQYTAAALVSRNKQLCSPASADSIPSSDGQEDHVSMGANGAVKALELMRNTEAVLAIEFMTSMQALDFRLPLKSGSMQEIIRTNYRKEIPHYHQDRIFSADMQKTVKFLQQLSIEE